MATSAYQVVNQLLQTTNQTAVSNSGQTYTVAIATNPIIPGSGSITVPAGNTSQRVVQKGALRLNTQTGFFECSLDGATWMNLAVGGGGISSVTGTANQIDCTAGPNVVVSIDAAYVGQTSITTLGTITTGTWAGTNIALNHGGTNAALTASNGGLVYSTGSAMAILSGTATANQIPLSGSNAAPSWSTATYPSTTTINQILYSNSANTITGLATANSGVLVTSGSGVPSILAAGTTNQILQASSSGTPSWSTATYPPTTTINQLLYSSSANTVAGLATANNGTLVTSSTGVPSILAGPGTTGNILQSNAAAAPSFSTATYPSTTSANQVLYSSSNNVVAGLASANNGLLVTSNTGVPSILAGPVTTGNMLQSNSAAAPSFSTATWPSTTTVSQLLYSSSSNVVAGLSTANSAVLVTNSSGVPALSSTMTNGQLIIGSTGATPTAGTLTNGTGINIVNGAASITVNSTGGFSTVDQSSNSATLAAWTRYITDNGSSLVTYTLPSTASIGDTYIILGKSSGGWKIAQNASQFINFGNQGPTTTGTGGSLSSTSTNDCVTITCTTTNNGFTAYPSEGNLQGA